MNSYQRKSLIAGSEGYRLFELRNAIASGVYIPIRVKGEIEMYASGDSRLRDLRNGS